MKWSASILACLVVLGASAYAAHSATVRRGVLKQVIDACELSKRTVGLSFPCLAVNPGDAGATGYAVIRGPRQRTEVLVVPTMPVTGIEDPAFLEPPIPAVWSEAWRSRQFVFDMLGRTLPRDGIGLAINSIATRSQDQLHIHVDCVDPQVRQILATKGRSIDANWRLFPTPLGDQVYWARSVSSTDLHDVNVAALVKQGVPKAGRAMGRFTIGAIGATLRDGSDGFYLFASGAGGPAEDLLDHACRD
jgi:CDP-diacylglycerol pyrophosphatase